MPYGTPPVAHVINQMAYIRIAKGFGTKPLAKKAERNIWKTKTKLQQLFIHVARLVKGCKIVAHFHFFLISTTYNKTIALK